VGGRFGTATVIVLDDRTCPVGMVHKLMRFFARESCGWCAPCRDGLPWTEKVLGGIEAGQARRDYSGAHTYHRVDKEGVFHTEWTKR
jgi:NADH-quinone oxidoreductase subunit F